MVAWNRWAIVFTVATLLLWAVPALLNAPFRVPDWLLIVAGLIAFSLFTAHYAEQYT